MNAASPIGSEFYINSSPDSSPNVAAIAADADGEFVAAWQNYDLDGTTFNIYARRFSAGGLALGNEFAVNTTTAGAQNGAAVAIDADGDFVVAWQSKYQDGAGYGVYVRRFDPAGQGQGGETLVNNYTLGSQENAAVAMDAAGNFAVVWTENDQRVWARRFNAAGGARGADFLVGDTSGSIVFVDDPEITMDADGDFAMTWTGVIPSTSERDDVYASRYSAAEGRETFAFRVNTHLTGDQSYPAIAMDADGDFLIAWSGAGPDSLGSAYARRFAANLTPTTVGLAAVTVQQDEANTVLSLWNAFDDPDSADGALKFSVADNSNSALFTSTAVSDTAGTLTLDYAPGQSGKATLTLRATDCRGLSVDATFVVTVIGPFSVSATEFVYQTAPHRFLVTFDRAVAPSSLQPGDLSVRRLPSGPAFDATGVSYDAVTRTATFTLAAPSLPDGDYRATLLQGSVTDASGTPLPQSHAADFFVLAGDADHDRSVGFTDLVRLAQNYNQPNKNFAEGDFDYSSGVGFPDLVMLAQRYGTTLPPAAPAPAPAPAPPPPPVPALIQSEILLAQRSSTSNVFNTHVPIRKPAAPLKVARKPASSARRGARQ